MSRSGYTHDCENLGLWRGAVASAIRGKRGQAFLRELLAALDALPEKRLVANELQVDGLAWGTIVGGDVLVSEDGTPCHIGEVCALGAVGRQRGVDMSKLDPEDHHTVADEFGIPHALACEIFYLNDEDGHYTETPEARWQRMRKWIEHQLIEWSTP